MSEQNNELVLASTSPRRHDLVSRLGVGFKVIPPVASEDMEPGEEPRALVERLALAKAQSVAGSQQAGLVVGADSVVVLDGDVLGKPAHAAQAREMLRRLRGRRHEVVTGVTVVDSADGRAQTASQVSGVTMRQYSDDEIEAYVASGEPKDKAAAYGVQDRVFHPASSVEGCYTNVMGLPLCLTVDMLRNAGYALDPALEVQVPEECGPCPLRDAAHPVGEGKSL